MIPDKLRDLLDYGINHVAVDGFGYSLTWEQDDIQISDIGDWGDCYGHTEWTRDSDYGPVRPSTFTGRARILKHDSDYSLWWEPYYDEDYPNGGRGDGFDADAEYRQVQSIMEWGFYFMMLKSDDGYSAALGGIEPDPTDEYRAEILSELYDEVCAQRQHARERRMVIAANRWLGTRLPVPN